VRKQVFGQFFQMVSVNRQLLEARSEKGRVFWSSIGRQTAQSGTTRGTGK